MTSLIIGPVTILSMASAWVAYNYHNNNQCVSPTQGDIGKCVKTMLCDANHNLESWWIPPTVKLPIVHVRWYTSLVMYARGGEIGTALPLLPAPSSLRDPHTATDVCSSAADAMAAVVLAYTSMDVDTPVTVLQMTLKFIVPIDTPPLRDIFFAGFLGNRMCDQPAFAIQHEAIAWTRLLIDAIAKHHNADALVQSLVGIFRDEMSRSVDMIGKLAYALDVASASAGADMGATGYCICACSVAFLAVIKAVIIKTRSV